MTLTKGMASLCALVSDMVMMMVGSVGRFWLEESEKLWQGYVAS